MNTALTSLPMGQSSLPFLSSVASETNERVADLTYMEFHALLIIPPLVLFAYLARRRDDAWWDREALIGIGIMVIMAVVYTTPWDSYLIQVGVWDYPANAIQGRFWYIPPGEYLFFILQSILTSLILYQFIDVKSMSLNIPRRQRIGGALAGFFVSAVGIVLLFWQDSTFYMGMILAWAGPVFAIQWAFGWPYLVKARKMVILGIGIPTTYLWVADWLAINRWGIWFFDYTYLTGIDPLGLPIEEATFFLVTNVFLVQGLVLWMWLLDRIGKLQKDVERDVPRITQFSDD
ncbi:lycopene cyclase domain-containing protein [Salinarchaeum sp. IM2453]|uniref:lycopene cyclase domain-containing protein n=1 Tax=Salinarchaeum sp. IM2453 TaxID=2862870 RepID=UPI002104BF3B|nr:lycopene cyclase domain-containing protein [Salinarchaeum sp. IM2453]